MRYLFAICLTLTSVGASADTYRWTDTNGQTVITDTPPPGKARSVVKMGGNNDAGDGLSFATKKAAEAFPVVLFHQRRLRQRMQAGARTAAWPRRTFYRKDAAKAGRDRRTEATDR